MTGLSNYEFQSPFLTLPAETRLQIYSCLIPSETLNIDLCRPRRPEQEDFTIRKRSIVSNLLNQVLNLDTITRTNGLHLLLVSKRTRSEVLPLLKNTTVRFHCPKCFEALLRNLSYGLGVGVTWMRHVEILVDLSQHQQVQRSQLTPGFARIMARETMCAAKRTAWLYYGRLDLSEREKWKFEPLIPDSKNSNTPPTTGSEPGQADGGLVEFPFPGSNHINFSQFGGPSHIGYWLVSAWFDV